eukprot:m.112801 g.112801  ORF g.112801 m.112801 type:complete len:54 (-) comp14103_c1_seq2:457-618(-)
MLKDCLQFQWDLLQLKRKETREKMPRLKILAGCYNEKSLKEGDAKTQPLVEYF